jgi:hypothetical protein
VAPTDDPFAPIAVTLASATAQPSPEVLHTADAAAAAATADDLLLSHEPEPVEIENPAAAAMAAGLDLDVTPFDPGPVPSHAAARHADGDETADLVAALQSMTDSAPASDDIVLDVAGTAEVESLIDAASETPAAFEIDPSPAMAFGELAIESGLENEPASAIDLSEAAYAATPMLTSADAAPSAFVDEDPLEAAALAELLQTASEISVPGVELAAEPAIADLFALEPAAETISSGAALVDEGIELAPAAGQAFDDLVLQADVSLAPDVAALTAAPSADAEEPALESTAEQLVPAEHLALEPAGLVPMAFDESPALDASLADDELVGSVRAEYVEETFALEAQDVAVIEAAADPTGLLSGLPDTVEAPGITDRAIASIEDAAALDETAFVPDLNYALDLADPAEVAAAEAAAAAAEAAEAAAAARRRKTIVALENFLRQVRARHLQLMSESVA